MNNALSNEFQSNTPARTAQTEALVSRQAQEVQAAMIIAKRFPRDENASFARIMQACKRKRLAEEAEYEFPRGGQKVTGPTIRLAEVIAQSWGNVDYGVIELEQKAGKSELMAYCWDLETNTRRTMTFTVNHVRATKKGTTVLDDPRDIYEMNANQGARRVRSCILAVIPGDVVDAATEECRKTIKDGNTEPLKDRVRKMLVAFEAEYQVSQPMIEKYIGCKLDAISENDFIRLKNVYRALRDGMAKREAYFEVGGSAAAPKDVGKSKAEDEFDEILMQLDGEENEPNAAIATDGADVPLE